MMRQAIVDALWHRGHEGIELEWRLGRKLNGAFLPGVDGELWNAVLAKYEKYDSRKTHVDTVEYIHADNSRRTVERGKLDTWMIKERIVHVDADETEHGCFRVSVAKEKPMHPPAHPAPLKFVRHKKRDSFFFKIWRLDCTLVTGNDPNGDLDNDESRYEVELELADPDALFMYTMEYIIEWGTQLACETLALR